MTPFDRARLKELVAACISRGEVTLASGQKSDFYVDGRLVVEDIDYRGSFSHPPSEAFDRITRIASLSQPMTELIGVSVAMLILWIGVRPAPWMDKVDATVTSLVRPAAW